MKKVRVVCMAILFACLFATASFAAFDDGKLSLTSELTSPVRGQSFTVSLEMNRNPGVTYLRTALSYDETVLELISVEDKGLLPSFSEDRSVNGKTTLHWKAPTGSGDLKQNGVLATMVFRIRDTAPYGDSRITVNFSDQLFDAQNKSGAAVGFDVKAFDLKLICSHLSTQTETVTAWKYSAEGVGKVTCSDCGESWEKALYPEIVSEDKKTSATVPVGEFTDDGEKSLRTEFLFGGALFDEAKNLFGDNVIRAFQLHFTKEGISFSPLGETAVTMTTEFEKTENFGLYLVKDGAPQKIDAKWENGQLSFLYGEGYFVLVEREKAPVTSLPQDTHPSEEEPDPALPEVTLSPEEQAKEKEIRIIALGVAVLVILAVGAVLVLRKGKSL